MTVKNTIEPVDVEWTMNWPYKPATQEFEPEMALAHLLMNGVVFLNSHWWHKEADKDLRDTVACFVNCNDVFAWASADGEELPLEKLESLYRLWKANPKWGSDKWCCLQRNEQPQKPIKEAMQKEGYWDAELEALQENAYWASLRSNKATESADGAKGE